MNLFKITAGLTLLLAFYALQNPEAIENIAREKAIYDSLQNPYRYAYEATKEEMKQIEEDRKWEGLKPKIKKGGKSND